MDKYHSYMLKTSGARRVTKFEFPQPQTHEGLRLDGWRLFVETTDLRKG